MRRPHHGAALVVAVAAWVAMPAVAAPTTGSMGIPIISAGAERVRWTLPPATPAIADGLAARLRAARDRGDSLAAWGTALGDSVLRPYALRRVAGLQLAMGDSAGADRAWAALARERSIWQWEALRARSNLAEARGTTARADSVLAEADRAAWPDEDRAAWLARRIDLRLAVGDTAAAITFAGQMLARYPGSPRATGSLLTLEAVLAARGDSLSAGDEGLAAEVDRLRGRREDALARLTRVARRPAGSLLVRELHLRRSRLLRELRRFGDAQGAAVLAMEAATTARDTLNARLERARAFREAGDVREALAAYAEAGRPGTRAVDDAWWERARFLEERGEWKAARADYARIGTAGRVGGAVGADTGRALPNRAALRAGLMSLAAGEPDEALRFFANDPSEASRFWTGVVLRRTARARGDSVLRRLAAEPGYLFYRSAARETLGVSAWSGSPAPPPMAATEPGIRLVRALDDLGCREDATTVLDRWAARDSRLAGRGAGAAAPTPGVWLMGAAAAYRSDRPRHAVRFVERAIALLQQGPDSLRWSVSPWLYPPAHDSLFAAWPESAAAGRIDRALLQAVAWKESHFDPRARSRSDALGLLQLKRQAVIDVARLLRESPPSDAALADPALNLRYGARYLERMLERFGGDLPLALAAYNAGPTVAKRWTRLRALGGDALACEEIDFPETQDYVKTILAVRQAYRELRPTLAP